MIDLIPIRKLTPQPVKLRIVRRKHVRIETSVLNLPFPLVAPEIITRRERERDDPQRDRSDPKNSRHPSQPQLREKRSRSEVSDAGEHRRLDKFQRHRLVTPIVETI